MKHKKKSNRHVDNRNDNRNNKINRDVLNITRRLRQYDNRRVYAIVDDDRFYFPDDLNLDRVYHDNHGRVVDSHYRPPNVNDRVVTESITEDKRPDRLYYDSPNVSVCQRRSERRRVLFALGKTGKGAKASKHRFTDLSKVFCTSK